MWPVPREICEFVVAMMGCGSERQIETAHRLAPVRSAGARRARHEAFRGAIRCGSLLRNYRVLPLGTGGADACGFPHASRRSEFEAAQVAEQEKKQSLAMLTRARRGKWTARVSARSRKKKSGPSVPCRRKTPPPGPDHLSVPENGGERRATISASRSREGAGRTFLRIC